VTDGEERSALAACRALAQAGHPVTVVAKTRLAGALLSRSCSARFVGSDPKLDGRRFVQHLARIVEENEHGVVLPGSEASLVAISEYRHLLEGAVSLALPPNDVVLGSLDKTVLHAHAQRAGLEPPPTITCRHRSQAALAARDLGYPVVLKPSRTLQPFSSGFRQEPVSVARNASELSERLVGLVPPFLVQRFVPDARRCSAAGVMTPDGLVALAAARFDRTWPVIAGAMASGETIVPPPELAAKIESLLRGVGWFGIFELEYLLLPDRQASAIDLNPRIFGWLTLAVEAGANLPAAWCDWVLGNATPRATARPGVPYRWEEAELAYVFWHLRRGRVRAAAAAMRPRRHVVHAHFRRRDPAPLFVQSVRAAANLWPLASRSPEDRVRRVARCAREDSNLRPAD
jgi:predicted ATP-grasp superfamily ATP-dependent carboligase